MVCIVTLLGTIHETKPNMQISFSSPALCGIPYCTLCSCKNVIVAVSIAHPVRVDHTAMPIEYDNALFMLLHTLLHEPVVRFGALCLPIV